MIHSIVYKEAGVYAAWPANHGAWQWGDEFLVGFLRGVYARNSMHNIVEPFELCQARSMDGGKTWAREVVEIPVDAVGAQTTKFDIGDSIIRVRGSYDHGGDWIDPMGCFWASEDKGRTWHGPHGFDGLESVFSGQLVNTSRTRTLGDLLFMSAADGRMWGTDYSFCAMQVNGEFHLVGTICDDESRAVMPAVARANGVIVAACRRRNGSRYGGWIDAFESGNEGLDWRRLGEIGVTGRSNGNPPALTALTDGRLLCCYANRTDRRLMGAISEDGYNWNQFVVRDGGEEDIGYPQLFMRSDGVPVCVYYWSDKENLNQHIAATEISLPC
jgi:hypothetical protein